MACLKCGRDTAPGEVFCETCTDVMQYYPVKPGTAVQLPRRTTAPAKRTPKRRGPTPEEQIKALKKRIWIQAVLLAILLLVALTLAVPAYLHLTEDHYLPGQNYSTFTPSAPQNTTTPKP